ncbi:MAG: histidine--tRNA ligase [Gemmataceae bacterium]|nr:histidine--tRNA ligase [Gemmataceae bacterium]
MIQPRTLKGFRDCLPDLMLQREWMLEQARRVYRSYGFAPIDTPALEYTEILLGKGGAETDKLIYRFKDHGDRDVALRFDLTVPFARFAAQYIGQLGTPFKRYHMGPVWRGENTGQGRYREFWQCDFDTIGTTSNAADIETALVIHDLMAALGLARFEIRFNNRMLLNGVLEQFGMADKAAPILRVLDKLPKIGREATQAEMVEATGCTADQVAKVLDLAATPGDNRGMLDQVQQQFGGHALVAEGIARLRQLLDVAGRSGIPDDRLRIDLSICRGLDYYTGTIYETFLTDLPGIGSVCSGGRYDDLASLYTKQKLPGVGASLGLDRLLAALEELKLLKTVSTPAPVLLIQFSADHLGDYQKTARDLRAAGIGVEVFPEAKKIGAQLQYAEKRGFRLALIAGPDEFAKGVWKIKDLAKRAEATTAAAEVIEAVRRSLGEL